MSMALTRLKSHQPSSEVTEGPMKHQRIGREPIYGHWPNTVSNPLHNFKDSDFSSVEHYETFGGSFIDIKWANNPPKGREPGDGRAFNSSPAITIGRGLQTVQEEVGVKLTLPVSGPILTKLGWGFSSYLEKLQIRDLLGRPRGTKIQIRPLCT